MADTETGTKPRLLGINHVALEVGNIDEALAFYARFFDFELRGRGRSQAFIDLGDQFLALTAVEEFSRDRHRHFGLVVDGREGLRARLEAAGVEIVSETRLDFLDPWGNRIEIVPYEGIQFMKERSVLAALGAGDLRKTSKALCELESKGITPPANV